MVSSTLTVGNASPSSRALALLRAVHADPGITRARLARELAMSSGVAADTVARLVGAGLLAEGTAGPTGTRGRPTRRLGPHPRGPLVAVAAVAHETWTVTTVQLGGEMLGAERRRHDRRWDTVSTGVQDALTTSCARYGARISAVVVSVPGTVSGTRLIQASNLGWEHVELSALAPSTGLRLPFFAGNDASFSAIAESRRGAALGTGTALHLYMDSGIGGALISAGALVAGAHGMAGEFGHMPFGQRNVRCRCGARGCWNTGLDGLALARELGQPAPADDVSFSRTVFDAARAGARAERRAVQRAASALGTGTAGLVNALDPEIVTFGGLAQELLEVDGPRVERAYREGLMSTRVEHPPGLARSAIGEHAPLIGAGERGFDHVLSGSALASWRSA